jgi:DNA (cytosine-5)-methyltransferase 1
MQYKQFTVFDSFAGAGGFSLGFAQAGYKIIGANEIDEWACDTFKANHPDSVVIKGDIVKISNKEFQSQIKEKVDVLLGGPPCQGFSIANIKNGDPKDPRNSLFEEFLRLGKIFNPNVMIMENVPNIINANTQSGKKVVDIIVNEMQKLGYITYSRILEATDYGVPQIRKRFVLIGSKKQLINPFPEATHSIINGSLFRLHLTPTLWEAISDLPSLKSGEEAKSYRCPAQNEFQKSMRGLSSVLTNHIAMRHSARLVERFKAMIWGQKGDELAIEHMPHKRNGNGLKADKGYSQNNRRMYPNRPCHTLPASFYANFVHPFDHRNFTPREGARIQTFPDTYIFKGKPTVVSQKLLEREGRIAEKHLCQYAQIGNAVPPLMAKAIAINIMNQIK